jgi:hypothetical protein
VTTRPSLDVGDQEVRLGGGGESLSKQVVLFSVYATAKCVSSTPLATKPLNVHDPLPVHILINLKVFQMAVIQDAFHTHIFCLCYSQILLSYLPYIPFNSSFHNELLSSRAHTASYPMCTGGYFPGGKATGAGDCPLTSTEKGKFKIKLSLCLTKHHTKKTYRDGHSLTSVLEEGEWSASRPGLFIPRERAASTRWIGGWVGSRASIDTAEKRKIPNPRRESNLRTPIG